MSAPISSELKRTLLANGFEVYRTIAGRIVLADRVRDNLIMDSGVAVTAERQLGVRITIRAQASSFPTDSQDELWKRARRLGEVAVREGYVEVEASVVPVHDPGDRSRTLDTWYEVAFERAVRDETELVQQLHFALSVEKAV